VPAEVAATCVAGGDSMTAAEVAATCYAGGEPMTVGAEAASGTELVSTEVEEATRGMPAVCFQKHVIAFKELNFWLSNSCPPFYAPVCKR
jgi:hypothetical protein